jgi:hypothetical protein
LVDIETFRRKEEIKPKVLLIIRQARDIPEVIECYNKMDFVDKLWVKYFPCAKMHEMVREYIRRYKNEEYWTHIILTSDDVYPSVESLKQLIDDLSKYDFPSLSGCCNYCTVWINKNRKCEFCEENLEHPNINVTILPVEYKDEQGKRRYLTQQDPYTWLSQEYRQINQRIIQCWFQGLAFGAMRLDIFEKYGCLEYMPDCQSDDFSFAVECSEHNILQFCDLRVYMRHDARYHGVIQVNKKRPEIIYERAKS